MQLLRYVIIILLMVPALVPAIVSGQSNYVGAEQCAGCHQKQYELWQQSHHAKAMAKANSTSVLGDFNNQTFQHDGATTRFSQAGDNFVITIQQGKQPAITHKVAYTFGFFPLQQYLLDVGEGALQAYDVAWDSRPQSEGGQRWFKLLPEENTGPNGQFHWQRQLNNWNSRCAVCHSTGLKEQALPIQVASFSEINVACEACHGPGEKHVQLIQQGQYSEAQTGFDTQLMAAGAFQFSPNQPIAQPVDSQQAKRVQQSHINACGGCHSRRQVIGPTNPAADYHDQYRISLLDAPLYHADGQILDEVFVLGSFMQSKMYQQGVTCSHCHDAHSGQVKIQGNGLCGQCHQPDVYNTKQHKQGPVTSELCVDCHMPITTYMGVDGRRDHGFFANPFHTAPTQFERLNAAARVSDPLALRDMADYINNPQNPDIRRATLLRQTAAIPSRLSAETLLEQLKTPSPLLRRAAVDASAMLPLEMRWSVLQAHLDDESASVRFGLAQQLAPVVPHLDAKQAAPVNRLLQAFRDQLAYSLDMPSGQATLSVFEGALGNTPEAIAALNQALAMEPHYLPARLNLADIYRSLDNTLDEEIQLQTALNIAPDNAAVQHSYGLYLIRQKQADKALGHLQRATEMQPSQPRYFYVYAVALESNNQLDSAIEVLKQADERWPNQYNLLMTLVLYLEKAQRQAESWPYLSRLSAIAPNDPEVKRRVQALQQ